MSNLILQSAYHTLGIINGESSIDEDVGVVYYKRSRCFGYVSICSRDALVVIAEARRSRFLRFLASIGEHLNEKNIAVLADKTFPPSPEPRNVGECLTTTEIPEMKSAASSNPGNVGEESVAAQSVAEEPVGGQSSESLDRESTESEMEVDAFGDPVIREESPSEPKSPSSPEASISSCNGSSADSDFSEEVSGLFFDRSVWRCEECFSMLVDGKCPDGHELRRCMSCGWQLDNGRCQRCVGMCGACGGASIDNQCDSCGTVEESGDDDTIAFDERDGLWRCIYCSWEVEADNATDGNCHCLNDKNQAHFIDLSDFLDYEPADSCSSEDDSSDSEMNSDDERFIDDAELPINGIASDATIETVNLAALYPAIELPEIMKATEMAKCAKGAEDKENVRRTASSDDIEIIEAPTANVPPNLPSNIIDCESMDT